MQAIISYLEHIFNPLHVYCRLRGLGISQKPARRWSQVYERVYRAFKPARRPHN